MAKNKVLVSLWLEDGCSQDEGEVTRSWHPINFSLYSGLFQDMVYEAVDNWLSDNTMRVEIEYELIFQHIREHDVGGALTDEYFEILHVEECLPVIICVD